MAPAPAFDPSQPFEKVAAPPFDPNKPFEHVDAPSKPQGGFAGIIPGIVEEFNNPPSHPSLIGMAGEMWRGVKTADKLGKGEIDLSSPEGADQAVAVAAQFLPTSPAAGTGKAIARIAEGQPAARAPIPPPQPGPFGVTLSEGQATRELPKIQVEQAALRGTSGPAAEARAKQFADQQAAQLAKAREGITKSLDTFGAEVADSPQEAGKLVSEGVASTARDAKAGVKQAYDTAKSYPGEIHSGVFEGISQKIKGDLSKRPDPVIIDDKLTPFASHAIQDIENHISQLKIQNRADPLGAPRPTTETRTILSGDGYHIADDIVHPPNIVAVNLVGVDQVRKRLSGFRKDAFASGNGADGRAAKAVLDAFDEHVDKAIDGGLFKGDPRAVAAWKLARAAHADYKRTFTPGKNDPVGRVVEKIIGKDANAAAIPNDVADFMYGSSGVNPSSLNVGVANRIKSILGPQSPEWAGVKQGLFHRLVDAGEGSTDFGPGKVAQRLSKFLGSDGKELSESVFSSSERALLWRYAELMRKLEVPQAGANWSNTATFMARHMQKVGSNMGMLVAAAVAHAVAPILPFGVSEGIGAGLAKATGRAAEQLQARHVAKQMPLVAEQFKEWQKASTRAASNPSRGAKMAANAATTKLAGTLAEIGIDSTNLLQFGGADSANPEQQQVPRPAGK